MTEASQFLYIVAGMWWALFTLPLIFRIKEPAKDHKLGTVFMAKQGLLKAKSY